MIDFDLKFYAFLGMFAAPSARGGGGAPLAAMVVISLYNCSGKIRPSPADPHNQPHWKPLSDGLL